MARSRLRRLPRIARLNPRQSPRIALLARRLEKVKKEEEAQQQAEDNISDTDVFGVVGKTQQVERDPFAVSGYTEIDKDGGRMSWDEHGRLIIWRGGVGRIIGFDLSKVPNTHGPYSSDSDEHSVEDSDDDSEEEEDNDCSEEEDNWEENEDEEEGPPHDGQCFICHTNGPIGHSCENCEELSVGACFVYDVKEYWERKKEEEEEEEERWRRMKEEGREEEVDDTPPPPIQWWWAVDSYLTPCALKRARAIRIAHGYPQFNR